MENYLFPIPHQCPGNTFLPVLVQPVTVSEESQLKDLNLLSSMANASELCICYLIQEPFMIVLFCMELLQLHSLQFLSYSLIFFQNDCKALSPNLSLNWQIKQELYRTKEIIQFVQK